MNNRSVDITTHEIEGLLKSIRPHPSQQFYHSLESAPWNKSSRLTTIPADLKFVLTSLSTIAFISVLLFTPVGRAIADGIAKFFTTTERESFQVPEEIILSVTQHVPSNPLEQSSPRESISSNDVYEEIQRIENRVGYELKEFTDIPAGFNLSQITEFPEEGIISIVYKSEHGDLILQQGLGEFPDPLPGFFDQVPAGEVQSVDVNNNPGEYVRGYFFVYSGETNATWVSDPSIQRLRWREGDRWFELQLSINVGGHSFLDKEELNNLAASSSFLE